MVYCQAATKLHLLPLLALFLRGICTVFIKGYDVTAPNEDRPEQTSLQSYGKELQQVKALQDLQHQQGPKDKDPKNRSSSEQSSLQLFQPLLALSPAGFCKRSSLEN